jgi:hypothetical protein
MSSDFGIDLDEIYNVVETAEVVIIRFQMPVDRRLLIDARSTEVDPPILRLVPRASSVEERFRSLKQLRPRLPVPDRIMSFQWPRHVRVLDEAGVWSRVVRRLVASGHPDVERMCEAVWRELLGAERREELAAIVGGEGWQTLWEREGRGKR